MLVAGDASAEIRRFPATTTLRGAAADGREMDPEQIKQYVEDYGPWAVGFGSLLDNTGVPIFFVLGMAAAGSLDVGREMLFLAALIGSIAGDLGVYVIGRYYLTKDRILAGNFGDMFRPVIGVGERVMQRWGLWSLILGRFIPYVGKITPLLAGSYRLSWLRAAISIACGSVLLIGGFYLYSDTAIELVRGEASTIKRVSAAIGTLCLLGLWWMNHRLKQESEPTVKKSRYSDRASAVEEDDDDRPADQPPGGPAE